MFVIAIDSHALVIGPFPTYDDAEIYAKWYASGSTDCNDAEIYQLDDPLTVAMRPRS